jgi:hypothetical protein
LGFYQHAANGLYHNLPSYITAAAAADAVGDHAHQNRRLCLRLLAKGVDSLDNTVIILIRLAAFAGVCSKANL